MVLATGFSLHKDDTLGQGRLTEEDYGWATSAVLEKLPEGCLVVSLLEGGYGKGHLADEAKEAAAAPEGEEAPSGLVASAVRHVKALCGAQQGSG